MRLKYSERKRYLGRPKYPERLTYLEKPTCPRRPTYPERLTYPERTNYYPLDPFVSRLLNNRSYLLTPSMGRSREEVCGFILSSATRSRMDRPICQISLSVRQDKLLLVRDCIARCQPLSLCVRFRDTTDLHFLTPIAPSPRRSYMQNVHHR